jgi:hypothetical protein
MRSSRSATPLRKAQVTTTAYVNWRVLDETEFFDAFVAQDLSISAIYPHVRHLSPTVRAFVDFLAARFGPHPYWDPPS